MSLCHAGSSGQALRTLSQCCGHSSDIPASQSEVCHHHHPYPQPHLPCRPLPTLCEGLSRIRSSEKGNRTFFINRAYLIFKG